MSEKMDRKAFHTAIDTTLSGLQENPFLYQRVIAQESRKEGIIVKKRLSVGLVLTIVLMLITVTALAVALLTPKEVVEQAAVPTAQSNQRENYTYEELSALLRTLNENGITLDEGSTLMQAFRAGRGYWEKDTIDEICRAAFGTDQGAWTLEQKHWYGEIMVAIGVTGQNYALLPEEGEISLEKARALAAQTLKNAYGVELPLESSEAWRVSESLEMGWDEEKQSLTREKAEWHIWYINLRTGNMDYDVFFDRFGQNAEPWRAAYIEKIDTRDIFTVMDDLQDREGTCTQWSVETWAEFGSLIRDLIPTSLNGWMYQHAGYRLPPSQAVAPEQAMLTAREAAGVTECWVLDNVICCTDGDRAIYKVVLRVFYDGQRKAGRYDAIWCVELDCETGEVLDKRAYTYGPDGNPLMMYVPFSLLQSAPDFEKAPETAAREQAELERAEEMAAAEAEYGVAYMYFMPLEKQVELFGGFHTVPSQEEYDKALAIAQKAVAEKYGADALESLGDYKTGVMHQENGSVETGESQHVWDFLFTTDTEYLSDGYRVQFRYPADEKNGEETVLDLTVEHANLGNG